MSREKQLEELLRAARRWRLMLDTFKRMRNSVNSSMRYQALGAPARDARIAQVGFWKALEELDVTG